MKNILFAIVVLIITCTAVWAAPAMEPQSGQMTDTEKIFWGCHQLANEGNFPATGSVAMICSEAYQEILAIKFGGDFIAYLEWRRANETSQLARLSKLQ